jgi:hypothetical protein
LLSDVSVEAAHELFVLGPVVLVNYDLLLCLQLGVLDRRVDLLLNLKTNEALKGSSHTVESVAFPVDDRVFHQSLPVSATFHELEPLAEAALRFDVVEPGEGVCEDAADLVNQLSVLLLVFSRGDCKLPDNTSELLVNLIEEMSVVVLARLFLLGGFRIPLVAPSEEHASLHPQV